MIFNRSSSVPPTAEVLRAIHEDVKELDGETVYAIAQGHDYDQAPSADDTSQSWIATSLSGLSIVGAPVEGGQGLVLAMWRPWTDSVSARSLPQHGVVEITWIDGTTSALEITDSSRRRRRGLALSIKEQIQGSIIVSERHVIAGQEVLIAVRRAEGQESFSQVIGASSAMLQIPEIMDQVNAIESKLRSMCGLTP